MLATTATSTLVAMFGFEPLLSSSSLFFITLLHFRWLLLTLRMPEIIEVKICQSIECSISRLYSVCTLFTFDFSSIWSNKMLYFYYIAYKRMILFAEQKESEWKPLYLTFLWFIKETAKLCTIFHYCKYLHLLISSFYRPCQRCSFALMSKTKRNQEVTSFLCCQLTQSIASFRSFMSTFSRMFQQSIELCALLLSLQSVRHLKR